jgi:hypothetical protein
MHNFIKKLERLLRFITMYNLILLLITMIKGYEVSVQYK